MLRTLIQKIVYQLRSRYAAFAHDLLMIPFAWCGAYWLRFNLDLVPAELFSSMFQAILVLVPIQAFTFWLLGLYRGVWRFASVPDLVRIIKAVLIGVCLSVLVLFVLTRMQGIPRSVPVLYTILLLVLLAAPRFFYRWIKDHRFYHVIDQRVLIIGAGRAGEMLVRDLLGDAQHIYQPVAFVDDNEQKQGREIHGIRVIGRHSDIVDIVKNHGIDIVMLAIPSAKTSQIRNIVEICEQAGVPIRIVPRLPDLVSGTVGLNELRNVSIEDLLGRDPVSLDWDRIRGDLTDKTIMISGAGGSIGSELCRQIARLHPARLVLLDNSEFSLFSIEQELAKEYPNLELSIHLTDVTDAVAVRHQMQTHQPRVVFHAAAYKHVPMLEHQIREAAQNNVLGTRTMAQAAHDHGVEEFVLISTDKAVNPANIMGASKRIAELFCQNLSQRSTTRFITVRFGNVLGSAGSVVPLFREQIKHGGPITVTHPEMTRYFMTIPEACQLIMQSAVMGKGGEIFVLDMGDPVKITYLAEQMIRLSGKEPGQDIEIQFTGLRPGEKLYEELFHEKERLTKTNHKKILLAHSREVDWTILNNALNQIEGACVTYDEALIRRLFRELVPEMVNGNNNLVDNVVKFDVGKVIKQ